MTARFFVLALSLLWSGSSATAAAPAPAPEPPLDPLTGMKMAENWELVRNNCIVCHSPKTFLQQRGTETTWTAVLAWMQKNGGMWKLEPQLEKTIIQYLSTNYGPGGSFRRAPIPATLMPVNPYATAARLEAEAKKKQGLIAPPPPAPRPAQ